MPASRSQPDSQGNRNVWSFPAAMWFKMNPVWVAEQRMNEKQRAQWIWRLLNESQCQIIKSWTATAITRVKVFTNHLGQMWSQKRWGKEEWETTHEDLLHAWSLSECASHLQWTQRKLQKEEWTMGKLMSWCWMCHKWDVPGTLLEVGN